jgi:hypothetical protein
MEKEEHSIRKGGKSMKVSKCMLVVLFVGVAFFAFTAPVSVNDTFSRSSLGQWRPVSGDWRIMGGKLVQADPNEKMAVILIPVSQSGVMRYQWELNYRGGGEDDYAGFGVHVCVSNPSFRRSWGQGRSLLGWVTWDPGAYGAPGAFIQVYESRGPVNMGLHRRVYPGTDIMRYGNLVPVAGDYLNAEYLQYTVPMKLELDTRTGQGRFYDPFDPDRYYFPFDLGGPVQPGDYFAFRTNSVSVAIDNVRIERIR